MYTIHLKPSKISFLHFGNNFSLRAYCARPTSIISFPRRRHDQSARNRNLHTFTLRTKLPYPKTAAQTSIDLEILHFAAERVKNPKTSAIFLKRRKRPSIDRRHPRWRKRLHRWSKCHFWYAAAAISNSREKDWPFGNPIRWRAGRSSSRVSISARACHPVSAKTRHLYGRRATSLRLR